MEGLVVILGLVLLAVPVLAIAALVLVLGLRARVRELEAQVGRLWREVLAASQHVAVSPLHGDVASPMPAAADAAPEREPTLAELLRRPDAAGVHASVAADVQAGTAGPTRPEAPGAAPASVPPPAGMPPPLPPPLPPDRPARPGLVETAIRAVRRWFTEGNVPVKVGVLVLFAGVAALLKYASDQGVLRLPIGLRLAGVALAALAALVFGWRQREIRRSFALAVQGGAVGVLLLVVFAAFRLYALIPAGAAFGLSVALIAGLCVLAVRQDALALAVLGVVAGFLAPIWLSTGQGDHVALFGYYAVLNAGIVAMAWRRPWRLLNVLGFVFTFGIGTAWGVLRYRPEHFATTEPFLVLFFAMYLALPILYAARRAPAQRRVLDGCLVFGTPLVAFSLQAGLLEGARLPLAFCALGMAALHAALAAALRRRPAFAPLVAPYAVIAVGFATLAVPLAVSAQATGAIFALEGAGLVWLALRQQRRLPLATGVLLQLGAALALSIADPVAATAPAVLNGAFMAGLLIAVSGLATALLLHRAGHGTAALVAYLWGLGWWLGGGLSEIGRGVALAHRVDAVMLFVLATGAIAAEARRKIAARALELTAAGAVVAPVLLVFAQDAEHGHPFAGLGAVAWLAYGLAGARLLASIRNADGPARAIAHVAWWLAWATAASLGLDALASGAGLAQAWRYGAVALPWLALGAATWRRPALVAVPMGAVFERWHTHLAGAVALVLVALLAVGCVLAGSMAPLPHVPLAGPLELAQIAALGLLLGLADGRIPRSLRTRFAAGATFVLATSMLLRAVHHWGGVDWDASMFSTGLVQTALTVLWSLIGMAAWVAGSRRARRDVWQAGAVLMAVVLAKLVLVDRQYLGNLLGIGSFLAFGLLCTAVGYVAPVPPRRATQEPV
ncbi:DUF2339 domain-containing protein [Lysobacter humi (ex Lee et al. 2017)]